MQFKYILLFVVLIGLSACDNGQNKFTISGEVSGMPEQSVVLEEIGINDIIVIDSTQAKNGAFELSGSNAEPGLYRLRFSQNRYMLMSIDKGKIKVKSDWATLESYNVTGSESSASLQQFLTVVREHLNDFNTMQIVLDSIKVKGTDSMMAVAVDDMREMNLSFTRYIEQYADTVPHLPNALFAAKMLNPQVEGAYMEAFLQSIATRFPDSKMAKDFAEKYNSMAAMNKQPEAVEGPAIGTMAPEISLATPDGKTLSLSSLKGKYVLVDFWASWCGPCRKENPNVVAAYNKYKGANFTILGVSLDTKKDKWLEAIKDDELAWLHVSDLKGWESIAARTYSVMSIPTNFLVDPNGNIIARDLRGEELDAKLADVMSN